MGIRFFTKNLNTRLYKRAIFRQLHELYPNRLDYVYYWRKWDWEVWSSEDAPNDPHFDGQKGIGGVTGMGIVKLYLEDKRTDMVRDIFRRVLRQNMIVASHEGAHSVLIHEGRNYKVALRHDDFSGHKAGTKLNFSTAEVHDRHSEGRFKYLKTFRYFDMRTWTLVNVKRLQVIDIDDVM